MTPNEIRLLTDAKPGDRITLDDGRVIESVSDSPDEYGNYSDWCDNCPLTHKDCVLAGHCVEKDVAFRDVTRYVTIPESVATEIAEQYRMDAINAGVHHDDNGEAKYTRVYRIVSRAMEMAK